MEILLEINAFLGVKSRSHGNGFITQRLDFYKVELTLTKSQADARVFPNFRTVIQNKPLF